MTTQERYTEKIAKLLRKAESTDSLAEAEALFAKAQELMEAYAIDQAMIDAARAPEEREQPDKVVLAFEGWYQNPAMNLAYVIARNNSCKAYYSEGGGTDYVTGKRERKKTYLHVYGFKSDLERVELLNASVQLQAARAVSRWWEEQKQTTFRDVQLSQHRSHKFRRDFLLGFGSGLNSKLHEAKRRAQTEAKEKHGTGMELMLRERHDEVERFYYDHTPELKAARDRRRLNVYAANAGYEKGRQADTSMGSGTLKGRRTAGELR